ncbi:MAG: M3 family oligoendopeptidase, partial [Bacteroidetes bacterium]
LSVYDDRLNRKVASHPLFSQLDPERYLTYTRQLRQLIDLFREENVELESKDKETSQRFAEISGAMNIEHRGVTLTMQQAGKLLEETDRSLRQEVWEKMARRRLQDRAALEEIFETLRDLRHQMATQAGYASFTRYRFDQLCRFDYTPADTRAFHEAVELVVRPIYEGLLEERRKALGVEKLRPWDMNVDVYGDKPLRPFENGRELLEKSILALSQLRPELGEMLRIMDRMQYLDLESREGKAPGGYNYPLAETGVPFIFMNAAGSQSDVITLLHESGHAVHSFMTRDISLSLHKEPPTEVAELASMSMELLCLEQYRQFYPDDKDLIRAQKDQLSHCITIFPWVATVDAFQQWAYDHPAHTAEERSAMWVSLYHRFHGDAVDWTGFEEVLESQWTKQLHIFEVPFYYIEYAISQLGALAVWRNFRIHPEEGLQQYLDALRLGYQKPIPEIYKTAGIQFSFSADYMRECVEFCLEAYRKLE